MTNEFRETFSVSPIAYSENCERCGVSTEVFYIWNARRLCRACLSEGQKQWKLVSGGPSAALQVVAVERKGLFSIFIKGTLDSLIKRKILGNRVFPYISQPINPETFVSKSKTGNSFHFRYRIALSEKIMKEKALPWSEGPVHLKKARKKKK